MIGGQDLQYIFACKGNNDIYGTGFSCVTRRTVTVSSFFVALTSILTGVTGELALLSPEAIRAGFLASVALVTIFAGATAIFGAAFQGVLLHTLTF